MTATVGCTYILYIILPSSLEGVTDFVDRGDRTYSLLGVQCGVYGPGWTGLMYCTECSAIDIDIKTSSHFFNR